MDALVPVKVVVVPWALYTASLLLTGLIYLNRHRPGLTVHLTIIAQSLIVLTWCVLLATIAVALTVPR